MRTLFEPGAPAWRGWNALLLCVCMASRAGPSAPTPAPTATRTWTSNFVTRVEALALLQSLNADLLSHDSATLTLERWCAAHKLASPAKVTAVRVLDADKVPTPEQRVELGVSATEPVRFRHVKLTCGTAVLSEADNWYVPARLTPDMNKQLDSSDTPFGLVVRPLHFQRHTLSSRLLWLPLPVGWEMSGAGRGGAQDSMPTKLLEHRAVLALPDGTPFSEVIETYTDQVLAFPVGG
jgi:hypothetical protein